MVKSVSPSSGIQNKKRHQREHQKQDAEDSALARRADDGFALFQLVLRKELLDQLVNEKADQEK